MSYVARWPARPHRPLLLAALLVAAVALLIGSANGQPSTAAIDALRVIDADTGSEVAIARDGDVLDLTTSGARSLRLEPVGVSEVTRSVAFAAGEARPVVLEGPPFILGATEVSEERQGSREIPVRSGEDDGEEFIGPSYRDPEQFPTGFTYHTSSDLELGYDPDHGRQVIGIRFTDIDLPPGALVERAEIVFTADGSDSGTMALTIRGESDPDPEPYPQDAFSSGSFDISSRSRTLASVVWIIDEPWGNRQRYPTPDLTPIVREVMELPGWHARRALAFIITGDGSSTYRRVFAYDGQGDDPGRVPLLRLEYRVPAQPGTPPLAAPDGRSTLRVTPYARPGGAGAAGSTLEVTLVNEPIATEPEEPPPPAAVEPPTPAEAAEADIPAPPSDPREPAAAAAATAPEAPRDEPAADAEPPESPIVAAPGTTEPLATPRAQSASGELTPLWGSDVRGTLYLDRNETQGGSLVYLELDAPARQTLSLELRAGSCTAPGDVLMSLTSIEAGDRSSANSVPISLTALRFGGFVLFAQGRHTPLACVPIVP